MSAGGKRPGAGRKPEKIVHQIILRETQPGRFEQIAEATDEDLTPLAVMQDNMAFFHRKAGELMAVIMQLPTLTHDEVTDAQVQALKDMAGLLRMREMAQMCARDLARYTTRPWRQSPTRRLHRPAIAIRGLASRCSNTSPRPRRSATRSRCRGRPATRAAQAAVSWCSSATMQAEILRRTARLSAWCIMVMCRWHRLRPHACPQSESPSTAPYPTLRPPASRASPT